MMDNEKVDMPYRYSDLANAWELVRKRNAAPGIDRISVKTFSLKAERNLRELSKALYQKKYTPSPLRRFAIPKSDGGVRVLGIPTVADRIIQRAVLTALEPSFETHFLSSSYAYRTGRSVKQAIISATKIHNDGYEWVVHLDVKDCFESIDWKILMERLIPFAKPYLRLIIRKWISAPGVGYDWATPCKGIPQGGVISPSMCNLVLTDFDRAIYQAGIPLVRYADDCLLFAKTERDAKLALLAAADALYGLKLEVNSKKTEIVNFDIGFKFLGTLFVRSMILPCVKIKGNDGKTRYTSGYASNDKRKRKKNVRVYRGKGHLCIEGEMPKLDLERMAVKAFCDELDGKSSPIGMALLKAYKQELTKTARAAKRKITPESVTLI